jgi:hypothetical protein
VSDIRSATRNFRFVITFAVEPDHPAYDDPEWVADAAHGTLTTDSGLRAIYTDIEEAAEDFSSNLFSASSVRTVADRSPSSASRTTPRSPAPEIGPPL